MMSFLNPYLIYIRIALIAAVFALAGYGYYSYRSALSEVDKLKAQLIVTERDKQDAIAAAAQNASEIKRQASVYESQIASLHDIIDQQQKDAEASQQLQDDLNSVQDATVPEPIAKLWLKRFGAKQ